LAPRPPTPPPPRPPTSLRPNPTNRHDRLTGKAEDGMAERGLPPEAVGVAVLALHNIAVHRVLPAPADAALNLATAVGLTAFAARTGCSPAALRSDAGDLRGRRAHLGNSAGALRSGLHGGLCAAAVATGGVAVAAALPVTRGFFDDRRV